MKTSTKIVVILAPSLAATTLILVCILVLWFTRRDRRKEENKESGVQPFVGPGKPIGEVPKTKEELEKVVGPGSIPYQHLAAATENFDEERSLGAGGSGSVYRGYLTCLEKEVAIKRVAGSKRGEKEFNAEVNIIRKLSHRNLVQLLGWCVKGDEFFLVYELMQNGSLDRHIIDKKNKLEWPQRYGIALGVASAGFYLHEGWHRCVVHRDIKSSNIMLDHDYVAKLGDFGLARLATHGVTLASTAMAGTLPYMAPECFFTGKASKETDVFSYGIVALELATGKRPTGEKAKRKLDLWVWGLYQEGNHMDAADKRLGMNFSRKEMERLILVALWCTHREDTSRPSFRQVISALNFEIPVPDLSWVADGRNMNLPFSRRVICSYGEPSFTTGAASIDGSNSNDSTSITNPAIAEVMPPR